MILSYIDDMGESPYAVKDSDLPVIDLEAYRINKSVVWFVDEAEPEIARRRWWVNGTFVEDGNNKTLLNVSQDEYFVVRIEKHNQFGTKTIEATFALPHTHINRPAGSAFIPDDRVKPIVVNRMDD